MKLIRIFFASTGSRGDRNKARVERRLEDLCNFGQSPVRHGTRVFVRTAPKRTLARA